MSADETEEEFSDDQPLKLPPVGPPSWDSNVVCIQPSRNLSRPEGHEEAEENNNVSFSSVLATPYPFVGICMKSRGPSPLHGTLGQKPNSYFIPVL